MAPKHRQKKPGNGLPRGQKPMVNARPSSDPAAANAMSSHIRPAGQKDGLTRKTRKQARTHGPLGNVRVDKKAQAVRNKAVRDAKALLKSGKNLAQEMQLNTALKPAGIVHKRGKKGKVFAEDKDTMQKLVSVVTARMDQVHATKIERAKELEAIREAKRKEIEKREQAKVDKLEQKKKDIKKAKRKGKSVDGGDDLSVFDSPSEKPAKGAKRRVRFAED
ncbi:hypothetical protein BZA70DRAFT_160951 [Myxozyma melibiosi]|uniref:60S ribosomal subunit assembly/export protein LOC1 n=1 Tax=Myxozyma melibiosi TaxID=54550 RepID=A0ABR1F6N3_9ASCO